jgi:hypothetical protein
MQYVPNSFLVAPGWIKTTKLGNFGTNWNNKNDILEANPESNLLQPRTFGTLCHNRHNFPQLRESSHLRDDYHGFGDWRLFCAFPRKGC